MAAGGLTGPGAGPGRPLRLAHRGDWRAAPENSLAAILAASRLPGVDGVEFDVRASADGLPVVVHDETLDRVHGRPERVDGLTAAALGAIGVPRLDEVLDALPATAFADIELKAGAPAAAVIGAIERAASRRPGLANWSISSFDLDLLRAVGQLRPAWPRWLNAEALAPATIAAATDLGCGVVAAAWRAIDAAAVARARAAGLEVAAWTVTDPAELDRLEGLGVRATCVEGPALERAVRAASDGRTVER